MHERQAAVKAVAFVPTGAGTMLLSAAKVAFVPITIHLSWGNTIQQDDGSHVLSSVCKDKYKASVKPHRHLEKRKVEHLI